ATAFAMIAAEELGLPFERIRVVHGDTDQVARGVGTFGSRSLQLGGSAVRAAAVGGGGRGRANAAALRGGGGGGGVRAAGAGRFRVAGTPAAGRSWAEVVAASEGGDGVVAELDFTAPQPTFPFGAHLAVVEVDTETGNARLLRLVAVDDAGRVLNPLLAEG